MKWLFGECWKGGIVVYDVLINCHFPLNLFIFDEKNKMNTVWWIVKIDLNKFLRNENITTALRDGGFYEHGERSANFLQSSLIGYREKIS